MPKSTDWLVGVALLLAGCGVSPVGPDAGAPVDAGVSATDAGVATDAGAGSPEGDGGTSEPPGDAGTIALPYQRLVIASEAPPGANGANDVPVGWPVTFWVYGKFSDGSAEVPPLAQSASVSWSVAPADGARLRVHDGVVEVTALRAGALQLTAAAHSPDGFVLDSHLVVRGLEVSGAAQLKAVVTPEAPWFDATRWFSLPAVPLLFATSPSAVAPVGARLQVLTEYLVGFEGHPTPVAFRIDPRVVALTPSGPVTSAPRSVATCTDVGPVNFAVSFSGLSTTAGAKCVAVGQPTALRLLGDGPPRDDGTLESSAAPEAVTLASILAADPLTLPTVGFGVSEASRTTRAWLGVRHGAGPDSYLEWRTLALTTRENVSGGTVYAANADGTLSWQAPGLEADRVVFGAWALPLLVRAPYRYGTSVSLRIEPPALTVAPGSCADVRVFVAPSGAAEHEVAGVEQLGLTVDPPFATQGLFDPVASRPNRFCAVASQSPVRTVTFSVGYLGAVGRVDVTVPK